MTVFTVLVLCHLHNLACPFNKKAFVPGYNKAASPIVRNLNTIRNTLFHTCLQRKLTPIRLWLGNVKLWSQPVTPVLFGRGGGEAFFFFFLFCSSTKQTIKTHNVVSVT